MNQSMFIVNLPMGAKPQKINIMPVGYRKNQADENGKYFLHGNGCKIHADCLSCPLPDCTWQPYPKPKRRRGQ